MHSRIQGSFSSLEPGASNTNLPFSTNTSHPPFRASPPQHQRTLLVFVPLLRVPAELHRAMESYYSCNHPAHVGVHPAWTLSADVAICEFSTSCGLCTAHFETTTRLRQHAMTAHDMSVLPRPTRQELYSVWPDFAQEVTSLFFCSPKR
jgi:hypothetical protein